MAHRSRAQDHVEILLADIWQVPRVAAPRRGFRPNVDSFHSDDPHELTVVVELPGVDPPSVTLAVSERLLVITGERLRDRGPGRVYQQMEIEYGPFERRVPLAEDVDPGRARARYEQGMLTVSLPVAPRAAEGSPHMIIVERG